MEECINQFKCVMPSKKLARAHGIKYWKKFAAQKKMVKLYSSSEESGEDTNEEEDEEKGAEDKNVRLHFSAFEV